MRLDDELNSTIALEQHLNHLRQKLCRFFLIPVA